MRASLWGPAVWKLMLACTWSLPEDLLEATQRFLLELVPEVLPCPACAEHYRKSLSTVNRKARGRPGTGDHSFRWCWYMKHEVNTRLGATSVHLADLAERFLLHGAVLPEVEVADVLVLMAVHARDANTDDAFVEFCATAWRMLATTCDTGTVFMHYLAHVARPIVPTTLRLARHTREAHRLPRMDLAKYKETVR